MADNREETDVVGDKDARRSNRLTWKEISEDMAENRQEMKKVRSSKFANMLRRYENTARSLVDPNTRELIAGATCLRQLTVAVKDQAQTLADVSARFSWQDLSTSTSNRFIRRHRENLTGVVNATSEKVENNEEDGNDEATNARVATLLKHLEAYEGQEFDLLKTLVDPINPVQSVENFFDYSYLHKEKKVKHAFNEETGTLTACIADPGELDEAPKTQMVLSFSIGDLKRMAELLYPEVHKSTSNSNNSKSNSSRLSHPLHREDPLYEAQDAQEQVRLLAKRSTPQKAQQAQQAQTQKAQKNASKNTSTATSSTNHEAGEMSRPQVQPSRQPTRAVSSTAQNSVNNNTSKIGASVDATQQAQSSSSSRRASVEHSVASSVRPTDHTHVNIQHDRQSSKNVSENGALDRMLPSGSCSSRYASTLSSGASSTDAKGTSPATPAKPSVSTPGTSGTPGTACSTGTAASFSPVDGPSYTPPLSPVGSPRRIATPGTASSTVTAASVSPLVPHLSMLASTTRVRSTPAVGLTISGTGGSDARGTGRRIPPSPSISPTPPRIARSALLGTHTSAAPSAQAKFVPIYPATTPTDSASLNSTESSRGSTPRSLLALTTSNSTVKSKPISVMAGKRALDLEELGKTEPLSQGSAKRRLAEVTPVLPRTPTHSALSYKPHGAGDMQGGDKRENKPIEQAEQNKQNLKSGQSGQDRVLLGQRNVSQANKPSHRQSPESVYSERTENMFVSASDGDSDSSSV
eukprot:gene9503-11179_t